MNQTKFDEEFSLNRQAYEKLRDQIRRDYGHQYVALAFGRIVASAPTFDAASAAVSKLKPQPEHFVVFEADQEPMFDIIEDPYTEFLDIIPDEDH
jgi:hypothetical protein